MAGVVLGRWRNLRLAMKSFSCEIGGIIRVVLHRTWC